MSKPFLKKQKLSKILIKESGSGEICYNILL